MSSRLERLQKLETAAKEYASKEKKKIDDEVKSLEAILSGRTGGAGIQQASTSVVEAVAKDDLAAYLKGA